MPPPLLPEPRLPSQKTFIDSLHPLPISSVHGTCPICQDPFSSNDPPVRLPTCGHTFCKSCILTWFHSSRQNSNTCPLDRAILFTLPLFHATRSLTLRLSALPLVPYRPRRNAHHVTLIQGGHIISINGYLTPEGCYSVISDLWHYTYYLFRQMEEQELDPLSVPEELLQRPVRDSVPRGVEIWRGAEQKLVSLAREMIVKHSEELGEGALGEDEGSRWAGELERVCGIVMDLWDEDRRE